MQLNNQLIYQIQDYFISFFISNIYLFIFLFLVYLGVLLDPRFQLKYRVFFLLLFFYLFVFYLSFFNNYNGLNSDLVSLIGEIFWYSLIIKISFIWHMCILDWLYQFFRYMKWDYLSFIITRISFMTSIGFFYYLSRMISWDLKDGNFFYSLFQFIGIDKDSYGFYKRFLSIIFSLLNWCLIAFMSLFVQYCLFFMSKENNVNYFTFRSLSIFMVTLCISYYILGIPRVYLIWIYIILFNLYKLILQLYNLAKSYKVKYIKNLLIFMYTECSSQIEIEVRSIYSQIIKKYYLWCNSFNFPYPIFFQYYTPRSCRLFVINPFVYYRKEYLFIRLIREKVWYNSFLGAYTGKKDLARYICDCTWAFRMDLNDVERDKLKNRLYFIFKRTIDKSINRVE